MKTLDYEVTVLLKAYVDSIQGGNARVVMGDDEVAVAISLGDLPPGTREGMVLAVRFNIDMGATKERKDSTGGRNKNER